MMLEWPPNWYFFFCIVAFLAASVAVRGWRELGALVLLSALLNFPMKWIGPKLGLSFLTESTVHFSSNADEAFRIKLGDPSPALLGAIIFGSLLMIAWKEFAARTRANP